MSIEKHARSSKSSGEVAADEAADDNARDLRGTVLSFVHSSRLVGSRIVHGGCGRRLERIGFAPGGADLFPRFASSGAGRGRAGPCDREPGGQVSERDRGAATDH